MGGKNPLVVLGDADIDYAVDAAAFGVFFHQGQVCMASSRVIVEAPLYEAFLERFVAKARTIKVGEPRDPTTVIGPLIRASQCDFIARQLKMPWRKCHGVLRRHASRSVFCGHRARRRHRSHEHLWRRVVRPGDVRVARR